MSTEIIPIPTQYRKPIKEYLGFIFEDDLFAPFVTDRQIFLTNLKKGVISTIDFNTFRHSFSQTYRIVKKYGEKSLTTLFAKIAPFFD